MTLTIRYTLFLAGVILVMLVGANLITANVVRNGLRDLFGRRLDYAGEALTHYTRWHLWSRWNEINTLSESPRFLAAVETADPSTINQEAPGYINLIGADLFVILDSDNSVAFSSIDAVSTRNMQAIMAGTAADTVVIFRDEAVVFETFLAEIKMADGFSLGSLAAGFSFDQTMLPEIKHLTGFDAVVTCKGQLIGQTVSGLTDRIVVAAAWRPDPDAPGGELREASVAGEKIIYRSLAVPSMGCTVTLIASIDEHITPILSSQLRRMFILAIVAGILAIGIIYLFVRRRIGGQVNLLVNATERIARDDMGFDISTRSRDEFGYLANQLDRMRSKLLENRRELEKAHEERIRATQLATIGQLAAGIIHDFKNPFAVIRGNAELMVTVDGQDQRKLKWCQTIIEQVDRMTTLTRDILEYSRGKSSLNWERIDLATYLEEAVRTHEGELVNHGIGLKITACDPVLIMADRNRLRRVFDNLVGNAVEALLQGGAIQISWTIRDDKVELRVSDNGPGIPADIVDTLFEPFVTSGKKHGTGLGLAITKKIVEEHGGNIAAHTDKGGGACFTICLPLATARADTHAVRSRALKGTVG
jgi:signal transduction histidine kinase